MQQKRGRYQIVMTLQDGRRFTKSLHWCVDDEDAEQHYAYWLEHVFENDLSKLGLTHRRDLVTTVLQKRRSDS